MEHSVIPGETVGADLSALGLLYVFSECTTKDISSLEDQEECLKVGRTMESRNWAIGESVVVKPGVTDPDTGRDIGGWQGRISAILDEAEILTIQWDSLTLKSIPPAHIAWSEEERLSWSEMNLLLDEVEPAAARDIEDDVVAAIAELESQTSWLYLGGEQGKRIQAIVNRAEGHNELALACLPGGA